MPAFTPTPEQLAIVTAATDTTDNLLVSALAGAAKTSTLEMIANALPDVNTICLAFNKKIATEMEQRLPSNCTAKTLNALGNAAWKDAIGKRTFIDFAPFRIFRALLAGTSIEILHEGSSVVLLNKINDRIG